ncbi:hypothetical protein B0H11DRAFT_1708017, partial [Mycena galericulata]
GISNHYGPLATTPISEFRNHWDVNTMGLVVLFQAAYTLLLASPSGSPVFAVISSGAGSIGRYLHISAAAYGSSKAAINFLVKALDYEHKHLISVAISPGWVATEMGKLCGSANGLGQPPVSVDESVAGILSRIDGATKEKTSGRFWNFKAGRGGPFESLHSDEVAW